jgi:hypothetical protein
VLAKLHSLKCKSEPALKDTDHRAVKKIVAVGIIDPVIESIVALYASVYTVCSYPFVRIPANILYLLSHVLTSHVHLHSRWIQQQKFPFVCCSLLKLIRRNVCRAMKPSKLSSEKKFTSRLGRRKTETRFLLRARLSRRNGARFTLHRELIPP